MTLDQEIYNAAISEGYSPSTAKLIVAQARLESANYSSAVFKKNNNLFGMKFVGQPLATKGSLAPLSERSDTCKAGGECKNSDHYAKYNTPTDSIKDLVGRLYKKERKGIGFNELRDVKDADEFATKLKQRDYFGVSAGEYALGLKARLLLVDVVAFYKKYEKPINYGLWGAILIGATAFAYWYYKRNK